MEALVIGFFVLKNHYKNQEPARVIPEPQFQPFNLAVLRLPREVEGTTQGAKANRQSALAVPAAC
jgi:hypothetical protein